MSVPLDLSHGQAARPVGGSVSVAGISRGSGAPRQGNPSHFGTQRRGAFGREHTESVRREDERRRHQFSVLLSSTWFPAR